MRRCKVCGKEFIPKVHNQIYCSKKCRYKVKNKSLSKLKYVIKVRSRNEKAKEEWKYKTKWEDFEIEFLKINYGKMTLLEIAEQLHRSYKSVEYQLKKLKEKGEVEKLR